LKQLNFARIVAEWPAGLSDYLPGTDEKIEVVDVIGAEINLQSIENVLGVDAHGLTLIAIEVDEQLGNVGAKHREQTLHLIALFGSLNDVFDLFLKLVDSEITAILDDDLEAAGRAEPGHRRRSEQGRRGFRHILCQQALHV